MEKHAPEIEHQRLLDAKRREQEQIEADHAVLNADQGFTKQHNLRNLHEIRWFSDADAARAKSAIHASEYRPAETVDPIVDVTPEATSPLSALQQQREELRKKLRDANADGDDLNGKIALVEQAILLMKKSLRQAGGVKELDQRASSQPDKFIRPLPIVLPQVKHRYYCQAK